MKFALVALTFWWWIPSNIPDLDHAFGAFVCNYNDTICRDKASLLPVAWRRYAP